MLSKQVRKCINKRKMLVHFSPFCIENHYGLKYEFDGQNDTYFGSYALDACKKERSVKFISSTIA